MRTTLVIFFTTLCILGGFSKTAEEWKSRSIYQIITDRFAKTDGDTTACDDLTKYCGGTFKGIQNNLDYIQGMGFDAIWISPVVANTRDGYHGYWVSDLWGINEKFGTPEELHELMKACHDRDIWVMVDVVANHVGYVDNEGDFSAIIPFNDPSHYNANYSCDTIDWKHQPSVETCWLSGLPDLNQSIPFVRETLMNWIGDFIKTYNFDGIRIDTIPHVTKDFWTDFSQASGVYTLGEVLSFDLPYISGYQGHVDGILNYALYSSMRYTFQNGGSMESLKHYYDSAHDHWKDVTILGNFVDNHDNPRFLHINGTLSGFKAALAMSMVSIGIPIVYYGDEYAFTGGIDPKNREPLWTDMTTEESEIYKYIKTINKFRSETQFYNHDQIERFADEAAYVFSRGNYLFAFTNSEEMVTKVITNHPYEDDTVLCDVFNTKNCVKVENGEIPITFVNKEPRFLFPAENDNQDEKPKLWNDIKGIWSNVFAKENLGNTLSGASKN